MANHHLKGQHFKFTISSTAACATLCHFNEHVSHGRYLLVCSSFYLKIPVLLLEDQKEIKKGDVGKK